ncbi:hypothetical protein D3C85_170090 [compost metagenome]
MKSIYKIGLLALLFVSNLNAQNKQKTLPKAAKIVVKVAVVIQDPIVKGKRMHETFKTPNYETRVWSDPFKLNADYEATLEKVSGGTIDYQIVELIDTKEYFTFLKKSGEKLTEARVVELLQEPNWKTLREQETGFDYKAFAAHFGFDKKCDAGELNEVWLWTFPYGGMAESNMMGDGAFWINSEPTPDANCKELLSIMGLNYERDLACALESYGHRFESTMMKVYGWWDYDKKSNVSELTPWERYAGYTKNYNKFNPGKSHIGNIHFPPNGEKDYNWANKTKVETYADNWAFFPNITDENPRTVDCSEWQCSHLGYMEWWYTHIPNFKGVSAKDGKLNNWWHYVVNYNEAVRLENKLNKKAKI